MEDNSCQIKALKEQREIFNKQIDEKIQELELGKKYSIKQAWFDVEKGTQKVIGIHKDCNSDYAHKKEPIDCYFGDSGDLYIYVKNSKGETNQLKLELVAPVTCINE